ncbi:MAG: DNA cytosine methyltransferase, partial [Acidimicrobiia bacterium]|nr:DNA cytosine methyltransferase [Acidimicrobiia bacterium]
MQHRPSSGPAGDAMGSAFSTVDLFSGCGGLTSGFLLANSPIASFQPVSAVDSDLASAATYATNIGDHVFYGDIEEWLQGAHHPKSADVVLGGPPCQGFSSLGKQEVTDERNALWRQYVEAVKTLQPKFFVLENVREFLRSEQFDGLRAVCTPSRELGDYEIEFFILDSSLYGAPQRRRRAIVIGRRRELPPLGEPPQCEQRMTVKDAFCGLST